MGYIGRPISKENKSEKNLNKQAWGGLDKRKLWKERKENIFNKS